MALIHVDPPPQAVFWDALTIYLAHAYDRVIPVHVLAQIERLKNAPPADLYAAGGFEREPPDDPSRYSLRLGNRDYPHMKLVMEKMPSRAQWLFRADTHDLHIHLDPTDPELPALQALHARNRETAAAIEAAWEARGVPTFRAFLHRDLDARRGAG